MSELRIRSLTKVFNRGTTNEVLAIDDIDLVVEKGEFLVIVGPNGSGKSTLLNCIAGDFEYDGKILYEDKLDLAGMQQHEISEFIARIYQNPELGIIPYITVAENLAISEVRGRKPSPFKRTITKKTMAGLLEEVVEIGLEGKLNDISGFLSGGQIQLLAIYMIIKSNPSILLLDEHVASLDEKNSNLCMRLTNDFIRKYKLTAIMITHNIAHACEFGDRIILMRNGIISRIIKKRGSEIYPAQKLIGYLGYT